MCCYAEAMKAACGSYWRLHKAVPKVGGECALVEPAVHSGVYTCSRLQRL